GEDSEQVAVRMVALGRARAAIAGRAEIGAGLQCSRREFAACTPYALGKLAHMRRNVHHKPVPEARASWRVGVVASDGEAFRACRSVRPLKVRRLVCAGAAKTKIG